MRNRAALIRKDSIAALVEEELAAWEADKTANPRPPTPSLISTLGPPRVSSLMSGAFRCGRRWLGGPGSGYGRQTDKWTLEGYKIPVTAHPLQSTPERMPHKDPEKQREADRKWRAANPEKAREANRRWRERNPEMAREATRRWHEANPGRGREQSCRWREANLEKARAREAAYRAANREARRVYMAAYKASQKEATRIHAREVTFAQPREWRPAEGCVD